MVVVELKPKKAKENEREVQWSGSGLLWQFYRQQNFEKHY